ncbi:MAG: AAA family ATPase [Gammaproteobacteria bacterium]
MLRERKRRGFVRECHGDMHLGNMTSIDGKVLPFDCIEFNPKLRWIDVVSELAFIVMDLCRRGFDDYGFRLINAYLQRTGDYSGLAVFRYYLVYRAMVKAKVSLLRLHQEEDAAVRQKLLSEYGEYVELADRLTRPKRPTLFITHGVSGSGKSYAARFLAEKMHAVQLRSDLERKRLFGFQAHENTRSGVGDGIYTPEAGRKTFAYLAGLTETILEARFNAIVDATFIKKALRDDFFRIAQNSGASFLILDFRASETELFRRVAQRRAEARDPSEADETVLKQQLTVAEPLTEEERGRAVTVFTEEEDAQAKLLAVLKGMLS